MGKRLNRAANIATVAGPATALYSLGRAGDGFFEMADMRRREDMIAYPSQPPAEGEQYKAIVVHRSAADQAYYNTQKYVFGSGCGGFLLSSVVTGLAALHQIVRFFKWLNHSLTPQPVQIVEGRAVMPESIGSEPTVGRRRLMRGIDLAAIVSTPAGAIAADRSLVAYITDLESRNSYTSTADAPQYHAMDAKMDGDMGGIAGGALLSAIAMSYLVIRFYKALKREQYKNLPPAPQA